MNLKFFIHIIFIMITTLSYDHTAIAASPKKCEDPIAIVKPCEGLLLPTEAAADGLKCLETWLPKEKLKLEMAERLFQIKLEVKDRIIEEKNVHITNQDKLLGKALKIRDPVQFWETGEFWFVVGVVVGAAAAVAITYAVNQ